MGICLGRNAFCDARGASRPKAPGPSGASVMRSAEASCFARFQPAATLIPASFSRLPHTNTLSKTSKGTPSVSGRLRHTLPTRRRVLQCGVQFSKSPTGVHRPASPRHCPSLPRSPYRFSSTMTSQTLSQWEEGFDSRSHSAANDFRSDTVTLPSAAMLTSILSNATAFGDDVFSEDGPTNDLERYVGDLTGMEHAVFVLSGTMGNQIALRCLLTQPPYSVICDRRSHIFEWECGMASLFSQAHMIPVMPDIENQTYLTLEDIIPNVVLDDGDTHGAPTKVITLENTFWGKVMPVEEVRRISDYARERGIKVHMDGARLWNACYASSTASSTPAEAAEAAKLLLREYCACVDSVSLCFSKSLGAPSGSILLSKSPKFISRARHFRKALGGGMRQVGILTSSARVALDHVFLSGVHMPRANALARQLEESWKGLGGQVQPGLSQETNIVWLDLKAARVKDEEFINIAKEEGANVFSGRIVTHYQITADAVSALERAFKRTLELGRAKNEDPSPACKAGSHSDGPGKVSGK